MISSNCPALKTSPGIFVGVSNSFQGTKVADGLLEDRILRFLQTKNPRSFTDLFNAYTEFQHSLGRADFYTTSSEDGFQTVRLTGRVEVLKPSELPFDAIAFQALCQAAFGKIELQKACVTQAKHSMSGFPIRNKKSEAAFIEETLSQMVKIQAKRKESEKELFKFEKDMHYTETIKAQLPGLPDAAKTLVCSHIDLDQHSEATREHLDNQEQVQQALHLEQIATKEEREAEERLAPAAIDDELNTLYGEIADNMLAYDLIPEMVQELNRIDGYKLHRLVNRALDSLVEQMMREMSNASKAVSTHRNRSGL